MKGLRKITAVVLCLMMVISWSVSAFAASEQNGLLYSRIDNTDMIEIVGITTDAANVKVPYSIRGLAVTQIGKSAFMGNQTAESISLTENILQISENAMYGMKALKRIVLPKNLTILGRSALSQCSALETVVFKTEDLTDIKEFTFYGCTRLNDVVLPDSIFEIGEYAFAQCMNLDNIYIPPTVSIIADTAFYSTKKGFTIYGYKNSQAYYYAQKITFLLSI